MPTTSESKKTGSTAWLLQRISGVILILLLLAHFWVQHFFINDFYGPMNIVDLSPGTESVTQKIREMNPLWGKHTGTYLAPVREKWKNTDHFLSGENVQGPTPITIVEQSDSTELLRGTLSASPRLEKLVGPLEEDVKITHETINPKQIKTKLMINHADVQARVANIWWKTYNMLFLVLAIYHGLTGMWDVLLDYKMSSMVRLTLYGSVITLGLLLFIVGTLIIVPMGL